ncbi:hypothetical protein TRFO_17010 [Tritrichomonas foetus]|uniref:Protein kinase domain-containing protein n=1 Tax=Tritrichomonas foetus TaxID=1144522 RepID=A0A1J4KPC4_9EUKA|nr:hypothetical protein TRFO_17010 [Tritrichomonas foetus]|eukprot:OHT12954.1 hypothetical protein TRFO_17010 [Tritrichomonas foetus]
MESFLCDFGAIRSPDNQEELTQNIGSDYYSAPELGSSTISTSSDLFSIGMIQYFLFLKTHPDRSNKESAPLFTKEYGRLTNLYQYLTDLKPNSRYNTFISIIYLICDQKNFYLNMIHNQCFQSEIFDGKVKDFDKSKVRGYDPSAHSENYIQLIYSLPSINSSHLDRKKEIQKKYNVLSLNDYDQEYYSNNKDKYGYLGNLYYRARYILSNGEKMMHFLEKASSFNHAEAQSIMGLAYFYGHHIPQDIRRSVYYFELAANNGHTYSQHMMGVFYKDHQTVPQDLKKSIKYFTMAANSNRKQSHYSLGMIYLSNNSYHDINKALHHLHVAADKHFDAKAMYSLGVLYVEGDLISQNLEKGITYLQNSALQLFLEAHFYLGKMYSEGKYISSDIDKAIHFLELPAQQNHVPSIHLLGHIYSEKLGNIQKALYYFEFSSQQNYSQSFIEMGLIYYLGTGVKIDLNKAFLYFVEAYKLNNPKAPLFIALIYLKKGMVLKALEYAKLSAEQNDVDAFILLGKIYSEMAVFKNIKKSIYYLEKACLEKSPQAQWLLGKIFLEVASVRNLNKGFNLLEQSSNQGLGIAQFYLGKLHFLGHYIEQNFSRATYYFNKAIEDLSIEIEKISTDYLDEYILACQACGYISAISAYLDKAKNYFVRVERFDHELTLNNLGVIYYFYDQDLDISKHYLMKSAEKNFILAEIILGIIYEKDNNLEESMKHFSKALELQDKNIYPDILMFSKCINLMKTYAKIKIIYLHLIKNISFESENLTRLSFKEISEQLFNRSDQENYIILTRSNSLYNDFYMLLTNNAKLINASQKITETIFYSPYTYLLGFFSTSSSNFINQDFIDGFLS